MSEIPDMPRLYLGDAVYAECRNGMLVLTTSEAMVDVDTNTIYLEPEVLAVLRNALDDLGSGDGEIDPSTDSVRAVQVVPGATPATEEGGDDE